MEFAYAKNARILLLAILGAFLSSLSYLTYIYDPLELLSNKITGFYPNSILHNLWKDPPYEVLLKVYVFNVTNAKGFLEDSQKLRIKEIGPYVYKETIYNINSTFNDNGTVSFTPKRRLEFLREFSVGHPDVDRVLVPNLPLLGMTGALSEESLFIQLGLTSLSAYLGTESFLNLSITDFLFGYDDPLVTLANDFIPNWIDFSRLGILDRIMELDNGSSIVTMNVNPEVKMSQNQILTVEERMNPFSIQNWNGSPGLKQWGYKTEEYGNKTHNSRCNTVEGSFLGTLFPRNIEKNTTLYLYRHAFCRTIPVVFEKVTTSRDGFEGYLFRARDDFLSTREENPENTCYCVSGKCSLKGVGNLSPCYYSIPISISQPHFLNSDPYLLEQVEGMSPEKEKHDITITIHPRIGAPLEAHLRLQINLAMPETSYNSRTRPFNSMVLPLVWIDLELAGVPSLVNFYLTLLYTVLPVVQELMMYLLAVAGVALIIVPAMKIFLYPNNTSTNYKSMHVNYSQIPVFKLRKKLFNPEIVIRK